MQPLVDQSDKLQSLFSEDNPEIIADLLMDGLKEITDQLVTKSRVQQRSRGVPYWCGKLEKERNLVKELNEKAIRSKQIEDARIYKHTKNQHSKNIIKYQKFKFRENMSNLRKRWNTLKDVTPSDDATPTEINHRGQTLTSSKAIANKFADYLDEKTEQIRNEVAFTNFKAGNIFKKVIARVEDDVDFPRVQIKEIKQIINGLKSSNSHGNHEQDLQNNQRLSKRSTYSPHQLHVLDRDIP